MIVRKDDKTVAVNGVIVYARNASEIAMADCPPGTYEEVVKFCRYEALEELMELGDEYPT